MAVENHAVSPLQLAPSTKRALVVLNPVAGQSAPDEVRQMLAEVFAEHGWEHRVHELQKEDPPARIDAELKRACDEGCTLIVAAGGDGTVSFVADAMIRNGLGQQATLGILPGGTANLLALELGLPTDLHEAARLLACEECFATLDAMRVGRTHYFLRVGVGLDALTIRDTTRQAKRWWGKLAYLWTLLKTLAGYGSHRFEIRLDGREFSVRAWQVIVANGGHLGSGALRLGPGIDPTDNRLELCVYRVHGWLDLPRIMFRMLFRRFDERTTMQFLPIRQDVRIGSRPSLAVQADGEALGQTPVKVELVANAIRILRPEPAAVVE